MAQKIIGNSSGNVLEVDSNNNAKVNLPTTPAQAGYAQGVYVPNSSHPKIIQVMEDGAIFSTLFRTEMDLDFNSSATNWSPRIGTNATTMTKSVVNGYMRLNNGAITTTATGISIYTYKTLNIFQYRELRVRFNIRHNNSLATNKQMEWGLGNYNFAAGQANLMNEFIGFRITPGGNLIGVLAYTTGGAPTELNVNINSGTPYSDNTNRVYEVRISHRKIEFWAEGTFQGSLAIAPDVYRIVKGIGYPVIARLFNSGTASAAPTLDVGEITAMRLGSDSEISLALACAGMDKVSHYFQPDLGMSAATHNAPASGTTPTAATGSNTASVLNTTAQLGGFYRMNGASFNVAAHSNVLISGFQNPALPVANGAGNNGRNFYVTAVVISPQVVSGALTGGPYTALWFLAVGATALSLATTDADGTTALAAKAPRIFPISRHCGFAAAAAAGTLETGAGDFTTIFRTPIPVHPGEFFCLGQRLTTVTPVTAGTIDGGIYVNGFWE